MTATTDPSEKATWQSWFTKAAKLDTQIDSLYQRLDEAVQAKGPTCWASGKCCKFDAYGHRLYVTGLEIARTVLLAPEYTTADVTDATQHPTDGCLYQLEGLCSVHPIRPLGCRIYFCQQGTQDWQQDLYEDYLSEIKQLHSAHGVEYQYMEWRYGLQQAAKYLPK